MGTIILAILIIFAFYLISKWVQKNAYHDPPNNTIYNHDDGYEKERYDAIIYSENEHSPEHLDLDRLLKMHNLRSKLKKIESERNDADDVNIDYTNYKK